MESNVTALTWDNIHILVKSLAAEISKDGRPGVIAAIARGGLIPAVMTAHAIGSRDLRSVVITRTITDDVNAAKTVEPVVSNPSTLGDLTGQDVLLVDDIAGTGDTLASARTLLAQLGAAQVRAAVLRLNTGNWQCRNREPDYVGDRAKGWVIFPWEKGPQ